MKILNEKGKLFGLINIIDLAVLLIVVLLVVGGLYYANKDYEPPVSDKTEERFITLKCAGFGDDVLEAIVVGDRLYYDPGFTDMVITEVRSEPAKIDVTLADGTILVSKHPELKDIYVTVKVNDTVADPMVFIGKLHATVGKDILLKTQRVEIPTKVTKVE